LIIVCDGAEKAVFIRGLPDRRDRTENMSAINSNITSAKQVVEFGDGANKKDFSVK
jgi:hypothetical protein